MKKRKPPPKRPRIQPFAGIKPGWHQRQCQAEYEEEVILRAIEEMHRLPREMRPHPVLGIAFSALREGEAPRKMWITGYDLVQAFPGRFDRKLIERRMSTFNVKQRLRRAA